MLCILARAKVNLTLDILGKRSDGYHELSSVMQSIELFDKLKISPATELMLHVDIKPGVSCWIPRDERNDVLRAARLLQQHCGVKDGARLSLCKFIPTQAGLGGGSADAAATLLGLNQFWQLRLTEAELHDLAARLGSDIVFTMNGGTALCQGRGELLTPLPDLAPHWLVLFKPPRGVSTVRAFQGLRLDNLAAPQSDSFVASLRGDAVNPLDFLGNHLQDSVLAQLPELCEFADRLRRYGVEHWQMSGSGSTIFAIARDQQEAEQLRRDLTPDQWWSFVTQTATRGVEIIDGKRVQYGED